MVLEAKLPVTFGEELVSGTGVGGLWDAGNVPFLHLSGSNSAC